MKTFAFYGGDSSPAAFPPILYLHVNVW